MQTFATSSSVEKDLNLDKSIIIQPLTNENSCFECDIVSVSQIEAKILLEVNSFQKTDVYQYNEFLGIWELYDSFFGNSYTFKGLLEDTKYEFKLTANGFDNVFLEKIVSFKTLPTPITLDYSLKTLPNNNTVKLKWDNTKKRKVTLKRRCGKKEKVVYCGRGNAFNDTSLKSNTKYTYNIAFENNYNNIKSCIKSKDVKISIPNYEEFSLPSSVSGECKTYAYYTAVTVKSSPQYQLLNSSDCYTDNKTGIRMVDDCYCVALGSYYGSKIGTKYVVTLESGKSFKVILCDQKADCHTDSTHRYAVANGDIVEFYCEPSMMPIIVKAGGSFNVLEQFNGPIKSIHKINT